MVPSGPSLHPTLPCPERMEVRICTKSAGQAHSLRTPPTDSRAAHRLTAQGDFESQQRAKMCPANVSRKRQTETTLSSSSSSSSSMAGDQNL
ncbi:hypothetical protein EYF80_015659 [Liparis tanakae]|uniref:Uncharacterized protein n=1 Tax=Liparis tanakae TaxID=230148 RepID=A0A4Z2I7U8_9TELE|nr:hypothetical protein EYF80_015659 [Liparis tanakae]